MGKKKIKSALVLGLVASSMASVDAYAQRDGVSSSNLNIRSRPTVNSKRITTIKKDTLCEILEEKNKWYKVRLDNGTIGWCSAKYMQEVVNKNEGFEGKVTASVLNLRSGPSTNYRVVKKLNKNTNINVIETLPNGWLKIKLSNGSKGYVSAKYISKLNSQPSSQNYQGKVTASRLNVRKGASTNNSIITTIYRGEKIEVLETLSNGWLKVKLKDNTIGYVSGKYIQKETTSSVKPPSTEENQGQNTVVTPVQPPTVEEDKDDITEEKPQTPQTPPQDNEQDDIESPGIDDNQGDIPQTPQPPIDQGTQLPGVDEGIDDNEEQSPEDSPVVDEDKNQNTETSPEPGDNKPVTPPESPSTDEGEIVQPPEQDNDSPEKLPEDGQPDTSTPPSSSSQIVYPDVVPNLLSLDGTNQSGVGDSAYEVLKNLGWNVVNDTTVNTNYGRLQLENKNGQDGIDAVVTLKCDVTENDKDSLFLLSLMLNDQSTITYEQLVEYIANGTGTITDGTRKIRIQYDGKLDYTITVTFYNY